MRSEASACADFSGIRYAQVWEDADILLEALDVGPGDVCVSIASAGDNVLAMLTRHPARVIAIDLNPAQLACLELRVAAYRALKHRELLELIGSRVSTRRAALYARCRRALSNSARDFWDAHPAEIAGGIGAAGRFERYLALFRTTILPLIHRGGVVEALLERRDRAGRERFYDDRWDTRRWRLLFRTFFSRWMMGRLGRDPACFRYVNGDVPGRILARTRHALTELDPAANPYVHWILTGTHGDVLPCALRAEHFDTIRENLDRLEWRRQSIEEFATNAGGAAVDRFNLSDVFEYVPLDRYHRVLETLVRAGRPGARLAYWNLLAPRRRPDALGDRLVPMGALADRLHEADRAFFYDALIIERVT